MDHIWTADNISLFWLSETGILFLIWLLAPQWSRACRTIQSNYLGSQFIHLKAWFFCHFERYDFSSAKGDLIFVYCRAYLDCHLMVTNPLDYVEPLGEAGASGFTFHVEVSKGQYADTWFIRAAHSFLWIHDGCHRHSNLRAVCRKLARTCPTNKIKGHEAWCGTKTWNPDWRGLPIGEQFDIAELWSFWTKLLIFDLLNETNQDITS